VDLPIWLWVTLAVALDGALALTCGLIPERWLVRHRTAMLAVATAVLLATGLGDILPEALESAGLVALAWIAGAMLVLGAIERASARAERHRDRPVAPAALLGADALHNLGDGMAIAAAFLVSPRAGIATTLAVMLHELPEELADYALLRASGMSRRGAVACLALVQLSAGIGAAGTLLAASLLARAEGALMAVACGMFLYIALFDLLPALWPHAVRARPSSEPAHTNDPA
jgi:zinc and cadmium transporter